MADRSKDWLEQARRNYEQAEASRRDGRHEWACFAAQQAAELAVKAVHLARGQEAWGHMVARLLADLPEPPEPELIDRAKVLDNFYVPTRYPNGHPEGAPFTHYGPIQSEEALAHARAILEFARARVAKRSGDQERARPVGR